MDKKDGRIPALLSAVIVVGAFGALIFLERKRPLRRAVEDDLTRNIRNLAVAGLGSIALQVSEHPVAVPLTKLAARREIGLLKIVKMPRWLENLLAVILLDYTFYLWHVLTHKVPFLWRFHVVHHSDLDMDASTALRFHFGELVISTAWRAGQIMIIGVTPRSFSIWQTWMFLSILFHHSNLRLPPGVENVLSRFIVTPQLHGIHHSTVRAETDSNWASGFVFWDKLHGTFRAAAPQNEILIGVPAYQEPSQVALPRILALPFEAQKPSWEFSAEKQLNR